jgi:hypothetical protein
MIPRPITTVHTAVTNVLSENLTIMLYGHTGAGKTALLGELAEYYMKEYGLKTRLYSADRGGWITIQPYIELGIIDVIPMFGDPWIWINHAVQGDIPEGGKWVKGLDPQVGMYAFEGMTSMADAVMSWMNGAASRGVNIGGGGAFSFKVGDKAESMTIGSHNMAHYTVAQGELYEKTTFSQYLPGTVLWTAGDRRGEDDAVGGVVGPQVAGKALTGEVPRWFKYTFRVATEVQMNQAPLHHLHMVDHMEMNAKMAKGMANSRVPLSGDDGSQGSVKIPSAVTPASLVKALEMLYSRQTSAKSEIAKRLGRKI